MKKGLFVVIEGSDGAGKATQLKLLAERLKAAGYDVDVYDFPRYDQPSSYFVQSYLNGEYGPASEISPYTASIFYALDRFEAAPHIRQSIAEGKIVLSNRYVGSNMAHQGAKFDSSAEQRGFFVWEDSLEFELLGLPRPSINIFLRVPADVSYDLIKKKAARSYTQKTHDEHEADIDHLRKAVATFDVLCQLFPKDFKAVECSENGKILSITKINNLIWNLLKPLLPQPVRKGRGAVVSLEQSTSTSGVNQSKGSHLGEPKTTLTDQSIKINDISLLALSYLFSIPKTTIKYSISWPDRVSKPRLSYYIPPQFSPSVLKKYNLIMDKLSALAMDIGKSLDLSQEKSQPKIIKAITPMSVLVNATIEASQESINEMIMRAGLSSIPELQQLSNRLSRETKMDLPKAIVEKLAREHLPQNIPGESEKVQLLEFWPRNEVDLIADVLYPHSNMSFDDIKVEIDKWTYQKKSEIIKNTYAQGQAILNKLKYRYDLIESQLLLHEFVNILKPDELQLQMPTVRYGYDVPAEVENLAIEDLYMECFDLGLELFSEIQAAGFDDLTGYATLFGHKTRWQFGIDGKSVFKHYSEKDKDFLRLISLLRDKAAEVHPLAAEGSKIHFKQERQKSKRTRNSPKTKKGQHSNSKK